MVFVTIQSKKMKFPKWEARWQTVIVVTWRGPVLAEARVMTQCVPELRETKLRFHFGEYLLGRVFIPAAVFMPVFRGSETEEIGNEAIAAAQREHGRPVAVLGQPAGARKKGIRWTRNGLEYIPEVYPRHYIDIDQSYNDFLSTLSEKHCRNLKVAAKKLAEYCAGQQHVGEYRTPEELTEFYRLSRRVSELTYQHRLLGVGMPNTEAYHSKIMDLAGQDRARGYILFHGERPIAFSYATTRDTAATYEITGYDPSPEYKRFSIGTMIMLQMIQRLISEGRYKTLDFGSGEAWYKASFGTGVATCCDMYVFPYRVKWVTAVAAHVVVRNTSAAIVKLLDILKIRTAVKKFLRAAPAGA